MLQPLEIIQMAFFGNFDDNCLISMGCNPSCSDFFVLVAIVFFHYLHIVSHDERSFSRLPEYSVRHEVMERGDRLSVE